MRKARGVALSESLEQAMDYTDFSQTFLSHQSRVLDVQVGWIFKRRTKSFAKRVE